MSNWSYFGLYAWAVIISNVRLITSEKSTMVRGEGLYRNK